MTTVSDPISDPDLVHSRDYDGIRNNSPVSRHCAALDGRCPGIAVMFTIGIPYQGVDTSRAPVCVVFWRAVRVNAPVEMEFWILNDIAALHVVLRSFREARDFDTMGAFIRSCD